MFYIEDTDPSVKTLTNGQRDLGSFLRDVDGYWVFYPSKGGGYYNEFYLKYLLDTLRDMNKEWDEQIKKDLK